MTCTEQAYVLYVRTQQEKVHSSKSSLAPVNACKRNSKKVEKKRTVKQMKLASYRWDSLNSLKTFDSCNEQPYVRTQLANREKRRKYNNKGSFKSFKILDSCNEQPDVCTQPAVDALALVMLAKASIMASLKIINYNMLPYVRARVRIQLDKNTLGRSNESSIIYVRTQLTIATSNSSKRKTSERAQKMTLSTSSKQMKLASYRWIACSNLRRKCNEHVRTQIAIASKLMKIIKIIIVKNHVYLLLTAFADPS